MTDMHTAMDNALNDETILPVVRNLIGNQGRFVTPRRVRVVVSHRYGRPVFFTVNNMKDRIHVNQMKGAFYEVQILEQLAPYMRAGGTFMDIGANVGNHSLYMLLIGGAARAIQVEPNPDALALLLSNMQLNGLMEQISLHSLGYGMGESDEGGFVIHSPKANLGWARVKKADEVAEGEGHHVSVRSGDSLLNGERVDFIKMDVEGMEIQALRGLRKTLTEQKPPLFVEVDHKNTEAFNALMDEYGYRVELAFPDGKVNQNFLMLHKDA